MFYLKPPRGDMLLNDLHDCVTTRVNYFLKKYQSGVALPTNTARFEYLILGTALDRIGHFTLRLLSTQSNLLKDFIPTCEAAFILERLEFLSAEQITEQFKITLRHLNELDCTLHEKWTFDLINVCTHMKSAFRSKHILNFNHSENCKEYCIKVPFQMCLDLVAKRQLEMDKGNVIVPCGKWKLFMRCLLETHFRREIGRYEAVQGQSRFADERLEDLKRVIVSSLLKHSTKDGSKDCIGVTEIENHAQCFPPCMANLYNNLKINHRLSHSGRFNFSLFLKDIGVPLNESIRFWRDEYSKPSKCAGRCSHSWQRDSKKYIYSVRHLYGLEGKRANYCSASCSKMQGTDLGPLEEGGCPFKMFDHNRLRTILHPLVVNNTEELNKMLDLRFNDQASEACHHYRKTLTKLFCDKVDDNQFQHSSPVEYFVLLRKLLRLS